ncbi:zinc finger MYM-type protein 1-like isoform X1 [Entelurus aequoreus]|uniref:zinc finger MYM-type protein 1-like isoform X1 n=1 Tax=Entelurus aequoreus TaxID=161455 RepID=UPI002B1E5C46|nr:zinc finger MYM-type protein 1-like isoform X1 [Entelurus aequoreus]
MCERTMAEYEGELCPTKEEKERQHQVVLHRTDVQQPPHIKEEEEDPQSPPIKEEEEDPQSPHIEKEEEEVWISQEGECLLGQEEDDVTKFPLTVVSVKTEEHEDKPPESSQLHHSPNVCEEQLLPENQECSFRMVKEDPSPDSLTPHIKKKEEEHSISQEADHLEGLVEFPVTGVPVKSEDDEVKGESEEKREAEPPSSSSTQHITEADGDHYGGSQADKLLAPLSDSEDTTSHSPDTDDEDSKDDKTCHTDNTHFKCSHCDKTFKSHSHLKRHKRTHTGKKPFSCSICGLSFTRKENMKEHTRTHKGETTFSCSVCDSSYVRSQGLKEHPKRYTGENLKCSACNSSCVQGEHLKVHKRTHTGEKPFTCSLCSKGFAQSQNLKVHMRTHTAKCSGSDRLLFPLAWTYNMEDYISKIKHFSKLDFQSKQDVIIKGRPMPKLKGLHQTSGQKTRSFQTVWYTRKGWLCGCPARNRLFCFSCLLFSSCDNAWTQMGYCDLKNLQRSLIKHERSTTHIQSQIALKTFRVSRIDLALDEQQRLNISTHNAKVKENRGILKDLINVTCFLAKQQLAFRGNEESTGSTNRGNYVELLHAIVEKDDRLARHLETSTVFSGLSNGIQNDLIEAVGDVVRNDIKKEISAAPFVAVEVDETTDVTNQAQISVILRYVATTEAGCEVREAFLGFDDVRNDRRAPAIAEYVLGVLEKYHCVEKLVAQTYDGAAVMASELNGVQAKIKERVPEAMFTHCYAHKLNLVLLHSAKCMPECRTFFKTAEGLASFFSKSTKRTHLLDDVVKRRLPRAAPTRWSSNSRLLQTISMHHDDLRSLFHIIIENPDSWDNDTLMMAAGYDQWLSKASTCFLLMVYEYIFNETSALCRVLQNKVMDIEYCLAPIRDTIEALERMRLEFKSFCDRFEKKCSALGLAESGDRQSIRFERKRVFCNILDDISYQMKARFDHFGELAFLGLVDCSNFSEMSKHFDDTKLQSLSKYARFFDFVQLKADLVGLYSSQTVRDECKSPGQLLSFLAQKDLIQTVPEATKLLQLVLTVPATTASEERSFSALKRIKTYSRNRTDQGRLSSLAVISIETERLLQLKKDKEDFYKQVIDAFVQKERRMDFIYK